MMTADDDLNGVSIRQVRLEAADRRMARERRHRLVRALTVAMAIFATFMVAVAIGVATTS